MNYFSNHISDALFSPVDHKTRATDLLSMP